MRSTDPTLFVYTIAAPQATSNNTYTEEGFNRMIDPPGAEQAREDICRAFKLFMGARSALTAGECTEFIRDNIKELGGYGYVSGIGRVIMNAVTIKGNLE